jgi:hypothetical protein
LESTTNKGEVAVFEDLPRIGNGTREELRDHRLRGAQKVAGVLASIVPDSSRHGSGPTSTDLVAR